MSEDLRQSLLPNQHKNKPYLKLPILFFETEYDVAPEFLALRLDLNPRRVESEQGLSKLIKLKFNNSFMPFMMNYREVGV